MTTTNNALKAAVLAAISDAKLLDAAGLKYFRQKNDQRYILASQKGANNGIATLDGNGKLTAAQLPNGLDDYITVDTLPTENQDNTTFYYVKTGGTGEDADKAGTIVKGTAGHTYRWVLNADAAEGEAAGYWVDITEVDTAKKALADDQGNPISQTYAKKTDVKTYTAGNNIEISAAGVIGVKTGVYAAASALDGKVDKVDGKGLSTNDYDGAAKGKLDGLANIKAIGTNLALDEKTGTLNNTYNLPIAGDALGGIKNGGNVVIGADGTANVNIPEVNIQTMTNEEIDAAFAD